jgi:hypothetical protein
MSAQVTDDEAFSIVNIMGPVSECRPANFGHFKPRTSAA